CQSFTTKPNSPVYQLKGRSVTLSWTYNTAGKTITSVWWFYNNNWIASREPSGKTSVPNARYQVSGPATLTISNVQEKDKGEYECQVNLSSGVPPVIKATAELIVVVRPSIILKTKTAQTLDEGAPLRLLCVASGNPKPSYTWYKDSVKIQEDPNNSNYTITSANRNDAGTYRCEAVVIAPTLGQYSVPYSVQVSVRFNPAHKVNSLNSNQTVLQGNDATFYCLTEAFPTATTYRWFKDGNQITNSANFEILNVVGAEESRLTIRNTQKGTAGPYSCDGTNRVGTGERKTAFLLVNYKPQLVAVTPDPAEVELGQSITLTCEADGFPESSYSWKFNGAPIGDLRNNLQLAIAQVLNAGNYTCVARNSFGSAEETRLLNVRYKPTVTTFTTATPDDTAMQGKSVTLICSANGYPAPTYTIKRTTSSSTSTLSTTSDGRYTISNVQLTEEDNSYSCEPQNSLGNGTEQALTITVIGEK
ncbi:neural cell adhesion molecule 1-A-like, partial [Stylophora pistillata]|uniref:neural cell adhesion molecule 1-A-like n=1 Tax=Stylophora pistillata TaxID=50429 RepID=UPI000C0442A7